MKWIASFLIVVGLATASFGQPQKKLLPDRPNAKAAQKRGAPAPGMMVLIEGLYVNALRQQGQQQAELTDDQIDKIIPLLRQYLRERNQVDGIRRPRARNQLQQAITRRIPDEELAPLIQEFDQVNTDAQATQERFFTAADPILTTRQRAWLRLFQIRMEERISNFIQEGRKP
jgi:Spy/CpxP family protein refolding chaperone